MVFYEMPEAKFVTNIRDIYSHLVLDIRNIEKIPAILGDKAIHKRDLGQEF